MTKYEKSFCTEKEMDDDAREKKRWRRDRKLQRRRNHIGSDATDEQAYKRIYLQL